MNVDIGFEHVLAWLEWRELRVMDCYIMGGERQW